MRSSIGELRVNISFLNELSKMSSPFQVAQHLVTTAKASVRSLCIFQLSRRVSE